jgi:TRAP-type mannitol/chloroaromatic compound transport system permease large subunit
MGVRRTSPSRSASQSLSARHVGDQPSGNAAGTVGQAPSSGLRAAAGHRMPQKVTAFATGLGFGRYGVLVLIMLMYLVLGCLMDAMAMIILTIPIIFPVITTLGFDPVWFGLIIVMTVELGSIHPPVGMNVFVIKTVVKDADFSTIFYGVIPFVITDIIRLAILISFSHWHGICRTTCDVCCHCEEAKPTRQSPSSCARTL